MPSNSPLGKRTTSVGSWVSSPADSVNHTSPSRRATLGHGDALRVSSSPAPRINGHSASLRRGTRRTKAIARTDIERYLDRLYRLAPVVVAAIALCEVAMLASAVIGSRSSANATLLAMGILLAAAPNCANQTSIRTFGARNVKGLHEGGGPDPRCPRGLHDPSPGRDPWSPLRSTPSNTWATPQRYEQRTASVATDTTLEGAAGPRAGPRRPPAMPGASSPGPTRQPGLTPRSRRCRSRAPNPSA